MNSIYLVGADDVRAGGSNIAQAADTIKNAASSMDDSLRRHQLFLEDWLNRLSEIVDRIPK